MYDIYLVTEYLFAPEIGLTNKKGAANVGLRLKPEPSYTLFWEGPAC